ncbi:MAG: hypothetical protein AB7E55_33940 [Pigmentiphaga sp.]
MNEREYVVIVRMATPTETVAIQTVTQIVDGDCPVANVMDFAKRVSRNCERISIEISEPED